MIKRLAIVLLCLSLAACGKQADIPAPAVLEATLDIDGTQATLTHGFLYESPYSSPDAKQYVLILMENQDALDGYLARTLKHGAPAITDNLQLSFTIRDIPEREGYDAEITFEPGNGATEVTLLSGFAPKGADDLPFPENYPGELEIVTDGDQKVWHLALEHEETEDDGTVNSVTLKAEVVEVQLDF